MPTTTIQPTEGSGRTNRAPAVPLDPEQDFSNSSESSGHRDSRIPGADALQALLAFSAMHQQVRRRRALASRHEGLETIPQTGEFAPQEQFVLDEVLQLVAKRAIAITGADGLAIALAENDEIVLRASAGAIKPDVGARIQRDSAFSGTCFRTATVIRCDDTETDDRVNLTACRQLGARSMVAVPLCGRHRVIGVLEAFSAEPYGFNDTDMASLDLLAELIVAALKPEDEDRFAKSAQAAGEKLASPTLATQIHSNAGAKHISSKDSSAAPKRAKEAISQPRQSVPKSAAPAIEKTAVSTAHAVVAGSAKKNARASSKPPGISFLLILILFATLLGGGIWWALRGGQFERPWIRVLSPVTVTTDNPAPAPPPANTTAGNVSSSATAGGSDASANSAAQVSGDTGISSGNTDEAPIPQETGKMTRITGIRHWSSADASTVVLDLEDQVQYEAHRFPHSNGIYFDLHDTSLEPELNDKDIEIGDPLLSRVRVAEPRPGLTRLVLEIKGDSDYSVSLESNPYRLLVQVSKIGKRKAQINLFPNTQAHQKIAAIVVPPPTKEDLQLRARVPKLRIVVDAGHGGWDLGTVGRRGLLEKDLVLEIAQRLAKLLETRLGANVILTRNDDVYIPLDERADIANQAQADLFVSVHANYSDLPSARGVETYFSTLFSAPNVNDLEARPTPSAKNSITPSLTAAELVDKIQQSRRLAASVQRSLYGTLVAKNPGLRDRGVKAASYVVLTETAMPGILAEVSFVSSPTDEQKLRSDGYREQISEALYKGIARYAAYSRGVKMASAGK